MMIQIFGDIAGQTIGILSCLILYYMFKYSDQFSDGNVGSDK